MSPEVQFFWGFVGSLAVEAISLSRVLVGRPYLPKVYRSMAYWLTRFMVAVVAGLLTVATQVQVPLLAMQIGVATPLIIDSWNRRPPRFFPGSHS
jgi:hypothetical protein